MADATDTDTMPANYGWLYTDFDKERKICEWTFRSPHDRPSHEHPPLKVTVTMKKARHNLGDGIKFVATCPHLKRAEGTDIGKLFDEVREACRLHDLGRRGIVWEDWIEVEVSGLTVRDEGGGASLHVEYKKIKRGVEPGTGRVLTIDGMNHVVTDFPSPKKAGVEERFGELDSSRSYIPATPANLAALEHISAKLRELRARLHDLLDQPVIERELATVVQRLLK
jgi:hypothetical protein